MVIILVFFSGELIWRDRDCKINEVIDATPHTSFISLAAKALSLVAITSLIHFFFIFCGVIYQLVNGFSRIEFDVYVLNFLYTQLPMFIIWSGLMMFVQVLSINKYVGYFVSVIIIFISDIMLSIFDVESNMLSIGSGPRLVYSDMNAFGPGLLGSNWFNFYWVLFAILCVLLAGVFWKRGISGSIKERMQLAKKQIPKSYKLAIIVGLIAWISYCRFYLL